MIAILSPHLDDAVLSCWHVLELPTDVRVINLFTAVPVGIREPPEWDRESGATNSAVRMHERLAEDRSALALVGRVAVNLDFLDEQYRSDPQPVAPIIDSVVHALADAQTVYAPSSIGDHPDHILARDVGLELARRGLNVRLYADLPHALPQGWPTWVTGVENGASTDVDDMWSRALRDGGIDHAAVRPDTLALDNLAYERKLCAARTYETQWPLIEALTPEHGLAYELEWELSP